jgi:hypothetical protein
MRILSLLALLPSVVLADVTVNGNVGALNAQDGGVPRFIMMSENDDGTKRSAPPQTLSPETDLDYRLRVAQDWLADSENFNYAAQNTGKHTYANTTMTNTWGATAGLTTNGSGITTITTGTTFSSRAAFPVLGTSTLSVEFAAAFSSATIATNTALDFGPFLPGAANPYVPLDGCFFRLTSAGIQGVCSNNGVETSTGVMAFTLTAAKKYQFVVYIHPRAAEFWIGDPSAGDEANIYMYGALPVPAGQAAVVIASALPVSIRHAISGGAASAVWQASFGGYSVRVGGPNVPREMGVLGNAIYGSYQGLSGGTMGSLANFANSANPTAAVPTNTTAALGSGLGGQFWETVSLAVNTDGIISSYQVPAATTTSPGRRLRIEGLRIQSFVQAAITGGPYANVWSIAFGHTAVSLATAEAAATKAPRRLPACIQTVAVTAAVNTLLQDCILSFTDTPIYVNPGEFIQTVLKHIGTVATVGTIHHNITFTYGWE